MPLAVRWTLNGDLVMKLPLVTVKFLPKVLWCPSPYRLCPLVNVMSKLEQLPTEIPPNSPGSIPFVSIAAVFVLDTSW